MSLPRGFVLNLVEREPERLPFVAPLLERWMALEFEPKACRAALEALFRDTALGAAEELLSSRAVTDGGVFATEALLFPGLDWCLRLARAEWGQPSSFRAQVKFPERALPAVAERVRRLVNADPTELGACSSWLGERVVQALQGSETSVEPHFAPLTGPGIYRYEHGCAVIRSRTTSLMLDPVTLWMPHAPRPRVNGEQSIDAVFVTHGHADHWSVTSICAQVPPSTLVVVPPVPRPSLLAPSDMLATLKAFGQNAIAPAWGSTLLLGDIQVDILPFYGEQPVSAGQGPSAGLRNWGSCYRFTTPEFSAIALIDSGVDPLGSMVDVVRTSCAERGPCDALLSSLPRFHCPFFFGLPQYFLTLPFERLATLYEEFRRGQLPSVTPGPDGVVEVCAAARARYYLPYGNGFEGIGKPIIDVGIGIGEPSEAEIVRYLNDRFGQLRVPTSAVSWNPGDRISFGARQAERQAYVA